MQPNPNEDTFRACFPDPKTRLADPSVLDCVLPFDAKAVDVKDSSEGTPSAAVFRKSRRLLLFIRLLFLVLHRFVKNKVQQFQICRWCMDYGFSYHFYRNRVD